MNAKDNIERLMMAGKWDEAIAACQAAILDLPIRADFHALQGMCHFRKEEYHRAVDPFLRATILDPGMWQAGLKLAQCYDRMGMKEEAYATAKEFYARHPSDRQLEGLVALLEPQVTGGRTEAWESTRRLDAVVVRVQTEPSGPEAVRPIFVPRTAPAYGTP